MRLPNSRGQNMLLFALTLLLLTLMVCITLSIGMKAKEKMELSPESREACERFLEHIDDHDDCHRIYTALD